MPDAQRMAGQLAQALTLRLPPLSDQRSAMKAARATTVPLRCSRPGHLSIGARRG